MSPHVAYWVGVATPLLLAYIGFGVYVMREVWSEHPSEKRRQMYESPFVQPPIIARSWTVYLALWLACPIAWPLSLLAGKALYRGWRRRHNAASRRATRERA